MAVSYTHLDNTIIPHYAILDADMTDSLPTSITVATGLDALTHSIEASTAMNASAMTRAIAMEAAVDILENLEAAAKEGEMTEEKKAAREKMHIASGLAGVAITNSCTGLDVYKRQGNDYVYVNCFKETVENPSSVAKIVSNRNFGIGSDGLILICPSETADFQMVMYLSLIHI